MFTDFFKTLWMKMFGTTEWLGLNIGFWMSMLAVTLLVVIMIAVFWGIKPKKNKGEDEQTLPKKNSKESQSREEQESPAEQISAEQAAPAQLQQDTPALPTQDEQP